MRILITGGAGYLGSRLVPALLGDDHEVVAYDTFWFGDHLPTDSSRLVRVQADIRDVGALSRAARGCEAVVHLACLSNDPSAEMDADLTRSINLEAFRPLVRAARDAGVRRFINCSTSSVYGISDAPEVREDHSLVPITPYNTYKAQCEPILWEYASRDFECVTVRPSTHCGYSPRQRLDLAVNILTAQAYVNGVITVHGGAQKRPNIHIDDMVDCYRVLLEAPADLIRGETFNVGAGNITIAELAQMVAEEVRAHTGREVAIETRPIRDVRSYQVNSDKIAERLGFRPERSVRQAVLDLCRAFDAGLIPDPLGRAEYVNIRRMREVFPDLYRGAPEPVVGPQTGVLSEIDVVRGAGQ